MLLYGQVTKDGIPWTADDSSCYQSSSAKFQNCLFPNFISRVVHIIQCYVRKKTLYYSTEWTSSQIYQYSKPQSLPSPKYAIECISLKEKKTFIQIGSSHQQEILSDCCEENNYCRSYYDYMKHLLKHRVPLRWNISAPEIFCICCWPCLKPFLSIYAHEYFPWSVKSPWLQW